MLTLVVVLGFAGVILAILYPKTMKSMIALGAVWFMWQMGGVWPWFAAGLFVLTIVGLLIEWGVLPETKPGGVASTSASTTSLSFKERGWFFRVLDRLGIGPNDDPQ